ncbi:endonuclease MutS2 [Helicobacter marmotae]|uniref:Endonuclease MutS2 n=1 Tax=Helicobacter marmotae TaxID=152490 RepID=A0A3D8I734_9HELI|nr:endonuclease MutS2 [Helicobacter marmotae]RDU60554.1 endonuclease MutS2 [Helicobacter marmotae]
MPAHQHSQNRYDALIKQLDLSDFLKTFSTYFAREKDFIFEGDRAFYVQILKELDNSQFSPPPNLAPLGNSLLHLQKYGVLNLENIFLFMQIMRYFLYLKSYITESTPHTKAWLDKILFPQAIIELEKTFDSKGDLKEGIYPDIDMLKSHITQNKTHIQTQLKNILHSSAIAPYLVDKSIHYINEHECLLLKAGYTQVIKGMVLERSHNGFFYLLPESIITLKERQNALQESLQASIHKLCIAFCEILQKHLPFLTFLNHAFDKFDHIHARLCFARHHNLSFIYQMSKQKHIILHEFSHPTLHDPKPLSIAFNGEILIITGVNAGGKTILLKSLLSACFLAKYLIPMKINPYHSEIPHFKHIVAIISDPQNSKNDISTFAGRMLEFKKILNTPNLLLGIDEIELGTDADEAASLYKVLLEHLLHNHAKVVLTTHHKHLSALMANNPRVQLCAAMYNVEAQRPLFSFLDGSIGKSYAFESAQRYGIPPSIIKQAKAVYGTDKERLNELIERSSELEITLKQKQLQLQSQIAEYEAKIRSLKAQEEEQKEAFAKLKYDLESTYQQATQTLKAALKSKESKDIHKAFNQSHKILKQSNPEAPSNPNTHTFKVGDYVKYKNTRGKILNIKDSICVVELESGFKLKESIANLKPSYSTYQPPKPKHNFQHSKSMNVNLDLHGMRGDEALERLDEFLSDALIAGYDEVFIYHGIGGGILSKLVYDYLKQHPKVLSFEDAPAQMGGYGAKIVKL